MVAKRWPEPGGAAVLILLLALLGSPGCGKEEPTPSPAPDMSETMPVRGPAEGYLQNVIRAKGVAQQQLALISARQSVQAYRVIHDRLPRDLDELQRAGFPLPELPDGKAYRYVPETGRVWLADVPRKRMKDSQP